MLHSRRRAWTSSGATGVEIDSGLVGVLCLCQWVFMGGGLNLESVSFVHQIKLPCHSQGHQTAPTC